VRPVLKMASISKSIGGIPILQDVNLSIYPGDFHILVGENGAGKSTLIRILSGLIRKDKGSIFIDDSEVQINSPEDAIKYGIVSIQQDIFLFDSMTVAENIFSQRQKMFCNKFGFIDGKKMNLKAQELIDKLGFKLESSVRVKNLNLAQKRMVEVVRLSIERPRILVLDEPLSNHGIFEVKVLMQLLAEYRSKGTAILYVTQKVRELLKYANRITVMRDSRIIESADADGASLLNVDKMVWGNYYPNKYPKLDITKGKEIFCVENLYAGNILKNINFSISQGEILGITGLIGSGRSLLAKSIFGLNPISDGTFYIDRLKAVINSPRDAISLGLAYVTDDRYSEGLFMNLNIMQNVFAILNINNRYFIPSGSEDTQIYRRYEKKINLKPQRTTKRIFTLSGGMQQKLLLMRWFLTDARIFILDEPTRGVDIPSKVDIYNLMGDLVRKKGAIILISSNIEELAGMCDRILVISNGVISHEARRDNPGDFSEIKNFIL
jgi:ABC-type sugar transport system ATPase subunit